MATVLIVDDNPNNRELLSTILGYEGYGLLEASNGSEGLRLASSGKPDLIIADILMPEIDGYGFVRALRSQHDTSGIPVIFFTAAYLESEIRDLARAVGVTRVLPKPSDADTIVEAVRSAIGAPPAAPMLGDEEFHREHLAVVNEKLLQKIRELETAHHERQKLLAHLVNAQEEERRRIAADIHDDSIQVMTALAMRLEMLARKLTLTDPDLTVLLARADESVRHAIGRLRNLLFQLRPPALDREGLVSALRLYLDEASREAGYEYELEDRMIGEPRLELRAMMYRIAQEALVNVGKHAGASHVRVTLEEVDDGYLTRISDDGTGFSPEEPARPAPGHLGLGSMRERAEIAGGWFRLSSAPGSGTTIEYWIPSGPGFAAGIH